ncbi:MAG: hypothetical protein DSZ30_02485 [Aquificaceae bacterium]|nr:MAG: hypothetical protein DSZ30_02485 [Aquificaceae bacterium]
MNRKKPLEELLTELKEELEDLIPVINRLQKELPGNVASKLQNLIGDLKTELQKFNQIQKEKTKKLQDYVAKAEKTLQNLEQSASEIRKDYENLNTLLAQQINANLEWLQTEISNLLTRLKELKKEIRSSAKEGIDEGLSEQIQKVKETLRKVYIELYNDIVDLHKSLKATRKELDKYQNTLAEIFENYHWSWFTPFSFLSILILIGILFIGLENANKTKAVEILLGFLEIIFLLTASYLSVVFWKKIQKAWVGYILSTFFLTVVGFIGYTIYKEKIVVIKKEVCNLPKPKQTVPQKDGSICYFYDGWYKANGNWYKGEIAICK